MAKKIDGWNGRHSSRQTDTQIYKLSEENLTNCGTHRTDGTRTYLQTNIEKRAYKYKNRYAEIRTQAGWQTNRKQKKMQAGRLPNIQTDVHTSRLTYWKTCILV